MYIVKAKSKKIVFHDVPVENREGEIFYGFRDVLIMEHHAKIQFSSLSTSNISYIKFDQVAELYKDITVFELLGA